MLLNRIAGCLLTCAAIMAATAPPAAAERALEDGTTAREWALDNGLRIVVRHVPGADAVAIVVAYPNGRDDDPQGSEGLAALMAEVAFTAAAGGAPARSHSELDSQRPVGWNVQVERRRTEFAEMATPEQFPGVLHQVALRMKGVQPDDDVVTRARPALLERRNATIGSDVGTELYFEIGQLGAGWDHTASRRWMSGEGLSKLRARDLAARIAEAYVPARAVLSLAGDFEGINLEAFIEREFGEIPAGTPRSDVMPAPARGGAALTIRHEGLERLAGGVGVVAPALSDSLHPSFFLTTLILGTHASRMWTTQDEPGVSRFQFSILDDPSVARFYPPIAADTWSPENLKGQFAALLTTFGTLTIELDQMRKLQLAVEWLLGGPLPGPLSHRVTTDRAVLYRICSAAATRELWGGEAFWSEYRRRFDPARSAGDERWPEVMKDPSRMISVIYAP